MDKIERFPIVREHSLTIKDLQDFEAKIASDYESAKINGVIHLSDGNEIILMEIFRRIKRTDWVFSAWRNHYHALLHGVSSDFLYEEIKCGRSMGIMHRNPNFFCSSIVCGVIPIALGAALSLKRKSYNKDMVWCFIGDMTYESGQFWEAYKYSQNHELPLQFVIEDNGKSVTTNTESVWGGKMQQLDGVIYYSFDSKYPHHGTGKWVNF